MCVDVVQKTSVVRAPLGSSIQEFLRICLIERGHAAIEWLNAVTMHHTDNGHQSLVIKHFFLRFSVVAGKSFFFGGCDWAT
jgi:hypothetical protein